MKLNEKQIKDNWDDLIERINHHFKGERQEKLLEMYTHFADRMMFAPASSREHYHNCFVGGYVDHVLRVMDCSFDLFNTWASAGAHQSNYTLEELMFAALNHDLGKVGDLENDTYIPNESEWHRKNQGALYTVNPNTEFSLIPDRSLFLLQHFGITYTWNEFLGIRVHDGMYDEANKPYLVSYSPDSRLRTNLPLILHQADMLASRVEWERWKHGENAWHNTRTLTGSTKEEVAKYITLPQASLKPVLKKSPTTPSQLNTGSDTSKLFDELFR
jgi:hypothetical protein